MSEYGVGANINGEMVEVVKPRIDERVKALEDDIPRIEEVVSEKANNLFVTTGATAQRPLADRFADTVNVKDFGAKGDGVTDDTEAFQKAYAVAGYERMILVPSGNYVLSADVPGHYMTDGKVHTNRNIDIFDIDRVKSSNLSDVLHLEKVLVQLNPSYAGAWDGMTRDGDTLYFAYVSDAATDRQTIFAYDITTGTSTLHEFSGLGHINDLCVHNGMMYVCVCDATVGPNTIVIIDLATWTKTGSKVFQEQSSVCGLTFDEEEDVFYLMASTQLCVYDKTLTNLIRTIDLSYLNTEALPDIWQAAMHMSNGLLYVTWASNYQALQYRRSVEANAIVVFDRNGKVLKHWLLSIDYGEIESIHVDKNGQAYIFFATVNQRCVMYTADLYKSGLNAPISSEVARLRQRTYIKDTIVTVYCSDTATGVGTGTQSDPFRRIADAIEFIKGLDPYLTISLNLSGDFTDEGRITFANIRNSLWVQKQGSATIVGATVYCCPSLFFVNVHFTGTQATSSAILHLEGSLVAIRGCTIANAINTNYTVHNVRGHLILDNTQSTISAGSSYAVRSINGRLDISVAPDLTGVTNKYQIQSSYALLKGVASSQVNGANTSSVTYLT